MMMDFLTFRDWGAELLRGNYTGLYPLPLTAAFALFALIPAWLGYSLATLISAIILVVQTKWRAPLWAAYVPVFTVLLTGDVDLMWWGLWLHCSPVSLVLMTLKPHLFLFALPQVWRMRRRWREFVLWGGLLYGPVTLIRPTWIGDWLAFVFTGDTRLGLFNASLWGVPILALLAIAVLVLRRKGGQPALLYLDPACRQYDYALLTNSHWALIPLSWVCRIIELRMGIFWTWGLLGLAASFLVEEKSVTVS